jgi:hypothetical protein
MSEVNVSGTSSGLPGRAGFVRRHVLLLPILPGCETDRLSRVRPATGIAVDPEASTPRSTRVAAEMGVERVG